MIGSVLLLRWVTGSPTPLTTNPGSCGYPGFCVALSPLKMNPILEDLGGTKDDLAREAVRDVCRLHKHSRKRTDKKHGRIGQTLILPSHRQNPNHR